MEKTLVLRLAGPMQSWGLRSRYTHRDTWDYPTFSGVIGLLSAALGRQRGSDCADLVELDMTVRVDRPGERVTDFHTAQTSKKDHPELSHRAYLADACFTVALAGDSSLVDRLADALRRPVFQLSLGRRACVPAQPVFLGVHDGDADTALAAFPHEGGSVGTIVRTVTGTDTSVRDLSVVWDIPYARDGRWHYRPRTVAVERAARADTPDSTATADFDPFDIAGA